LQMSQLMPLPLTAPASVKSRLVLLFSYWLTWLVPDKGPLDGCVYIDKYSYLFTLASEVSSVGLTLVHMDRHQVHLWLQSNQLEWIALGPEYEYPLSQSIHVSMFHPFGCV